MAWENPPGQGESDYSALVMAFIRSIEARAGSTIDRSRGGQLFGHHFGERLMTSAWPRVDSNGTLQGILKQWLKHCSSSQLFRFRYPE